MYTRVHDAHSKLPLYTVYDRLGFFLNELLQYNSELIALSQVGDKFIRMLEPHTCPDLDIG